MIGRIAKTALVAVLLAAFSAMPSLAQAGVLRAPATAPQELAGARRASVVPEAGSGAATVPAPEGYAAREAAAPGLAQFIGGDGGIYIGGGVITVLLLVILIVILI